MSEYLDQREKACSPSLLAAGVVAIGKMKGEQGACRCSRSSSWIWSGE